MLQKTPPMLSGGWPFVGHALEMNKEVDKLLTRGFNQYNGPFAIRLMGKNVAVLTGPDQAKFFYTETDKRLNINSVYTFIAAVFGETIFIGPKEQYANQRVLLQAIFTRERMAGYVKAMQAEIQLWLDSLGDSGELNLTEDCLRLTQHVAGHAFLGSDFRKLFGPEFWGAFVDLTLAINPIVPKNLPLPVNIRKDRALKRIKETFTPLIRDRRQHPEKHDDVLNLLANTPQKDGSFMDDQEIINFMTALFWAGHETTAGQSAWVVTLLLQHPDYLKLVHQEIAAQLPQDVVIGGRTLRDLKHIYWSIEEAVRMRPAAPVQLRLVEEDVELDGFHIPAGWLMMVNGPVTHNDPKIWQDPERFDPFRHGPERHESKNSFTNVNFGGGIHKCAGMNFAKNEMAIIVGLLFQQFEVELLTPNPHTVFGIGAAKPSDVIIRYKKR